MRAIKLFALSLVCAMLAPIFSCSVQAAVPKNSLEYEDIVIYNNKNNSNKIALTFDDGPHPKQTLEILDILDEYGIKATFFVVGVNAENYSQALIEVARRGHEIGNHTYYHSAVSKVDYNSLKEEIEGCESRIFELTDRKTKLFRPPEGLIDTSIRTLAKSLDYKVILWDIDTRDWAHTSPQDISRHVVSNIKSGDIILMHDYIGKNSPTAEALRLFIPKLIDMGYKFVVISELIGLDD